MAKESAIEWTDATWNPWIGCTKVSAGCANCYMFRDQKRFGRNPNVVTKTTPRTFRSPYRWKDGRLIFVCSWSDFFHPDVPTIWREEACRIMACTPHHSYLLLTKRPELIREQVPLEYFENHPHIWLGISAENQAMLDLRFPYIRDIPAGGLFVSAEPLLAPLPRLYEYLPFIDWFIDGGESDRSNPRRCGLDAFRSNRDQCYEYGIPYFHKQHGGRVKIDGAWGGCILDGVVHYAFPENLRRSP